MVDPARNNEADFKECVIGSTLEEARIPKGDILRDLEAHHFCERSVFAMKLALEEALCNAVKHGNKCDKSKCVTIRYDVDDERAIVIVRDEGCGFQPDDVPDPTAPDRLSQPNGRGIMLMCAYMDEVRYRDRGREVYFVKYRLAPECEE